MTVNIKKINLILKFLDKLQRNKNNIDDIELLNYLLLFSLLNNENYFLSSFIIN